MSSSATHLILVVKPIKHVNQKIVWEYVRTPTSRDSNSSGILRTGIAYILNFDVVRHAPATIASSVTYLTSVFAVLVGVAFLGESLSWNEPVGALLILVGVAFAQDRIHRRPRRASDNVLNLELT